MPALSVTPDKYVPHRYAGASGDFNPIHIDPEFAKAVGLPQNILHGLYSMAQVARAATQAGGGDPRSLKRLSVQFRGMGVPEHEIQVTGTVREAKRRPRRRRHGRRAGRQPDRPQRRSGAGAQVAPEFGSSMSAKRPAIQLHACLPIDSRCCCAPSWRPMSSWASRSASKWLAERSDVRWSPSTIRYELAALEELGYLNHPHTSAGRVPTDAGYRYYADTLLHEGPQARPARGQFELELSHMRREVDAAMRVHHRPPCRR